MFLWKFSFQHNIQQRTINSCTISKQAAPELLQQQQQGQEGSLTLVQPNLYRTTFENGQPVMVTLNPYSTQLVDNLNKMMGTEGGEVCYDNTMNPQLARLTATLRKKQRGEEGVAAGRSGVELVHSPAHPTCPINPTEVVFRSISPHGHVYWEINPAGKPGPGPGPSRGAAARPGPASSSDENTNSDLQNISDFSDDDQRAHSEMSRQSSSRFSESRPLIYSSSASTSPGHSAASAASSDLARTAVTNDARSTRLGRPVGRPNAPWAVPPHFHEEVYAYAATDFSGSPPVSEQVQSQVQIRDCRALPVSVKSKEYIMAKIADYTERTFNQV